MSYSKQQIAVTANYIADRLFSQEEVQLRKWFCSQFKESFKGSHQAENRVFSVTSPDFSTLIEKLHKKNVQVSPNFQVTLSQDGESISEFQGQRTMIGVFKDKQRNESRVVKKLQLLLNDPINIDDDSSEHDDEFSLEDEYKAPPSPMFEHFMKGVLEPLATKEKSSSVPVLNKLK